MSLRKNKNHTEKKWEISIRELKGNGKKFKVSRRLPELSVAETKIFKDKKTAKNQFEEWLK